MAIKANSENSASGNKGSIVSQIPAIKSNNARIRLQNEDDLDIGMLNTMSGPQKDNKFR